MFRFTCFPLPYCLLFSDVFRQRQNMPTAVVLACGNVSIARYACAVLMFSCLALPFRLSSCNRKVPINALRFQAFLPPYLGAGERLTFQAIDESVSINQIKKFFTIDAWKQVEGVIAVLKKKGEWSCVSCSVVLDTSDSISCDCCLNWMHMKCVGLKSQPKRKYWICRICHLEDSADISY